MPINTECSVEIDRPIREVFEYTTNNSAEWSLTVVEDEPIDTMPDSGVGSTFRCVTENRGQRMEFHGTVTQHEPPVKSAVRLEGLHFDIEALYLFEDLSGATRVTQVSVVKPKGMLFRIFLGIAGFLLRKSACDAGNKELRSLKTHLEDGPSA